MRASCIGRGIPLGPRGTDDATISHQDGGQVLARGRSSAHKHATESQLTLLHTGRFRRQLGLLMLPCLVTVAAAGPEPPGESADKGAQDERDKRPPAEDARPSPAEEAKDRGLFHRLSVVSDAPEKVPGSVHRVGLEELRRQDHSDVHRVLRAVPGVNLQEEDGYGLRPNIGMRGTGVERSQKITLLEDGVLIAPAPYSAPSAYYFPSMARMEGIEVRKGSSSIRQGPYTNGGALELTSSSIPSARSGHLNLALGQDGTRRGHLWVGDSSKRFGWLVETFQMRSDGFKTLPHGASTGFELQDYMAKLRLTSGPEASIFQAVELKLGRTDQLAQETYLGLTRADFDRAPYSRYAASARDEIDSEHQQVQLRYFVKPAPTVDLTTTVYRNDFFRNWYKLNEVEGISIADVVEDPEVFDNELAILRGEVDSADDALELRNNRRDYYSQGIQTVLAWHLRKRATNHEFEIGLRWHEDAEDRFQEDDGYRMSSGFLVQTSAGPPGKQSNHIGSAEAVAFFAQDTIHLDRWTLTPGVRLESIDFERRDYGSADPSRSGTALKIDRSDTDVVLPGLGVHYRVGESSGIFAGVHRGFGPPGPGNSDETRPEESINYEMGYRREGLPWNMQLVAFYSDYDNLLGRDTTAAGGSGSGDAFNGGAAEVRGLEASFATDLGQSFDLPLGLPLSLSYTYTEATFGSSFVSGFAGWGDSVERGDALPYLPPHQVSLGVGLTHRRASVFADLSYTASTRALPGQGPIPAEQLVDDHLLVDLTANLILRSRIRLFLQMRNLTDEVYVAARRPAGLRPGIGRTTLAGLAWDF